MDYKHIEQLLERYWQCETSVEEEKLLREFFMSSDVPKELEQYREVFIYQSVQQEVKVSPEFEEKLFDRIEAASFKIKKVSFVRRIAPLFRAAVFVGVFLTVSNLVQHSIFKDDVADYNYETYIDTYTDPEIAYEKVSSALMILSEGLNKSIQQPDSLNIDQVDESDCDE